MNNLTESKSWIRSLIVMFLIAVVLGGIFGLFMLYSDINSIDYNPDDDTITSKKIAAVETSEKNFQTDYFEFKTDESWLFDKQNQKDVYVYKSMRGNLVEQILTISVNVHDKKEEVTRVLPVVQNNDLSITVGDISDHCGSKTGYSKRTVVIDQVQLECFGDDTRYTVAVGSKEGETDMILRRPNGTQATYRVYYSNSSLNSDKNQLKAIMNSFKVR